MKTQSYLFILLILTFSITCEAKSKSKIKKEKDEVVDLVKNDAEKRIDVMVDGKLFTSYRWAEGVYKPVLYPIIAASGTTVTRGFPLDPKPGERADHRHHVGNWLNYGDVNGFDFWGNGHTGERSENGGEIIHKGIEKLSASGNEAVLVTTGIWVDSEGKELLSEKTEYHFIAKGATRIIDRIVTLTAVNKSISLNDTKEGMFAIRVAHELELPSSGKITIVDENGNPKELEKASNEGITGNYKSSEGITGMEVWGTRAKWMNLYGSIQDEKISIAICDHPENISYPTYWHARGYGLFSANPLGVKDFTEGKEKLNFSIPAGQSVTFKYRLVIGSNTHFSDKELNAFTEDFAKKY